MRRLAHREAETRRQNRLKSKAIFEELCKTAGEKIYRTADNVEGVTLLRVWNEEVIRSEDKLWKYTGLGNQDGYEDYIKGFLEWEVEIIPTGYPRFRDRSLLPETENSLMFYTAGILM